MAGNGEVELYYGCTEGGYKGTHSRTETYALHNISWTPPNADGVAVATFNDEETLHSLSPSLTTEVFVVLEHAARCAGVKVLVWTAAGERAFCSGAALKGDRTVHVPAAAVAEYLERGMAPAAGDMVMANQTLAFWDFPKPIVGAINGLAVGGGANMALANYFDVVICSDKARFMYPFAKLGITPELGSSVVLPAVVGLTVAKEMLMLGEWVSATKAVEIGLASRVVPAATLLDEAMAVAKTCSSRPAAALSLAKQLLNNRLRSDLEAILAHELVVFKQAVKATGGLQPRRPKL